MAQKNGYFFIISLEIEKRSTEEADVNLDFPLILSPLADGMNILLNVTPGGEC